jgi:hypothetical protein
MSHGTEHHLEEAEHAQHHAQDPFTTRVAMTMAIVAAALAGVTMLSHRSHNDTLRFQNDALRLQNETHHKEIKLKEEALSLQEDVTRLVAEAGEYRTQATDQWNYFQAKKNREYQYEALAEMLSVTAKDGVSAGKKADQLMEDWKKNGEKYKADTKKIEDEARAMDRKAKALREEAQLKRQEALEKQKAALELAAENKEHAEALHHSHEAHGMSNRFDFGELGVEMALVLCSVAVLTKRKSFWYGGIAVGVVGLVVGLTAFLAG